MSAKLRLEGNFLELVKDLFTRDVDVSAEHSDETFKIFDGKPDFGVSTTNMLSADIYRRWCRFNFGP